MAARERSMGLQTGFHIKLAQFQRIGEIIPQADQFLFARITALLLELPVQLFQPPDIDKG
jgi:hypothetical protein